MPRTFPLAAVLAVRQQKEDAEERALATLSAEVQGARAALARMEQELLRHREMRAGEVEATHSGAHHQAREARWRMLQQAKAQLNEHLLTLETRRQQQQACYLAARSDREMLTELRQAQRTAWEAELQSREAKRMADLFTARWMRN